MWGSRDGIMGEEHLCTDLQAFLIVHFWEIQKAKTIWKRKRASCRGNVPLISYDIKRLAFPVF